MILNVNLYANCVMCFNYISTDCASPVRKEVLNHDIISEELKNPEYGPKKLKHLTQNASLLCHAEMAGFCENETAFVEFGAGRGTLCTEFSISLRHLILIIATLFKLIDFSVRSSF